MLTMESSANEHVQNAGKKTVMPTDVFQALEDTEFGFLREPLEAEFASAYHSHPNSLFLPISSSSYILKSGPHPQAFPLRHLPLYPCSEKRLSVP